MAPDDQVHHRHHAAWTISVTRTLKPVSRRRPRQVQMHATLAPRVRPF